MNFTEFSSRYEQVAVQQYPHQVKTTEPLVSVCVQTYQHEPFIRQCLDSILQQKTNFTFEVLIGEDASKDETRNICIEYANKYSDKVRLFLHNRENNIRIDGTPTGRFNFAYNLFSSKGKYIALCEGDDYWTDPLKLQKQIDFLEENERFVISFHDTMVVDENNKLIREGRIKNLKAERQQYELVKGAHLPTNSVVFRNLLKSYPERFFRSKNGDTFLFAILGQHGPGYFNKEVANSVYRVHSNGMWSTANKIEKLRSSRNTFDNLNTVISWQYKHVVNRKLMSINWRLLRTPVGGIEKLKVALRLLKHCTNHMVFVWFRNKG
ncbi:glycosyltransferase [Fulvivirga ulvae]|uniref:glycosyltransferase n=1 Tax=Fulvivirga ulvae TaxID=2904245 RepID=UPI001F3E6B29|nr:glycosyltransferase [Fulvivirga ulvae]UII31661.1 glycosyltransferase [Fulvivirga ulvae]